MIKKLLTTILICGIILLLIFSLIMCKESTTKIESNEMIELPEPRYNSEISIEKALSERRSVRTYTDEPITLEQLSQLLWAAQGITNKEGFRTAPSAGALYPLEIYIIVGNVIDLDKGIYKYNILEHKLLKIASGDKREDLSNAALGQDSIKNAAIDIIFSAVYERTTKKYGERAIKYIHIEVGHAAQNIFLQSVSLNLAGVPIGAFYDDKVKKLINMPEEEEPLYIIPLGNY